MIVLGTINKIRMAKIPNITSTFIYSNQLSWKKFFTNSDGYENPASMDTDNIILNPLIIIMQI